MSETSLTDEDLVEIERTAVDLANLGGARIVAALGRTLSVRYKSPEGDTSEFRDPVSEVDHEVEALIREKVSERFAHHDVLGEESEERPQRGHDVVWAVDPIDGTTNFVNGFPLFASSIGVLWRGRPIAGAVWCSTSHALRPGVYHAREGGILRFDYEEIGIAANPAIRRRLVGLGSLQEGTLPWDVRKTGSAAVECAFVAAGLLEAARFDSPNVWDVAGGIPLVLAAGGAAAERKSSGWDDFEGFLDDGGDGDDVGSWRRPVIVGRPEAVASLRERS